MKEGVVIKSTGSWYIVKTSDKTEYNCKIKGQFRIKGIKSTNPIAVGDYVYFSFDENEKIGVITKIKERKNYIVRKSVNLSKQLHIIATNIDVAFLMVTIKEPETSTEFIDRVLVTSQAYKILTILLFNKIDILSEKDLEKLEYYKLIYSIAGYKCVEISLKNRVNLDIVKQEMQGKTSVIVGHSGVGKSTLINTIDYGNKAKVSEISEYHKSGKHTTTFAEMHELSFGGYYIDTPGIKGFGLFDFDKLDLHKYFPEIFELSKQCKYSNCTHIHEPDCAVKKALENNELSQERYYNYVNIFTDGDEKHRSN
jgi:ribosome biogenesis GTPase